MTWMRRGLLALVMVVGVACGSNPPPSTEEPGGPLPPPPPPQVIAGSLQIHTRFWETDKEATRVYVMLGDGTRFFKKLDASGDVTFEDPSLVGPQDVTLVAHYDEYGYSHAYTYLALERPEVWLRAETKDSPAQNPQRAYITGKVTGMHDANNVRLYAVGRGVRGYSAVNEDGSFRIQVEGTLPAMVDLFAVEEEMFGTSDPKTTVGLKRGITVPAWQQVSGPDVSLDHLADQQTRLTLQGVQSYQQSFGTARLAFYQDGQHLFGMSSDSFDSYPPRFPTSVPAIALTAPFDTTRAMLSGSVGAAYELPSGSAFARVPVENPSSVTLPFPKPMTLTSPAALGTTHEPAPASSRGLIFQWSTDAAAQRVEFSIAPHYENYSAKVAWTVTAPGSVTSFKPFRLRLDETSFMSPFFYGPYQISLDSSFDGAIGHYADFFTQKPAKDPLEPAWSTSLEGALEFR